MQIDVEFGTQVRAACGLAGQVITLPAGSSLRAVLAQLTSLLPALSTWIDTEGQPRAGLLVFVNDQSAADIDQALRDGDQVSLLTMVSGG